MTSIGIPTNFNNKFFTRYFVIFTTDDKFKVGKTYEYTWLIIHEYPIVCVSVEKKNAKYIEECVFFTTFEISKADFLKKWGEIDVYINTFRQEVEF